MSQQPSESDNGLFRWFTDTAKTVGNVAVTDYLRREYPEQTVQQDVREVVIDPGYWNQQRASGTPGRSDSLSSADLQRMAAQSQTRLMLIGVGGVLAGILAYSVISR